MAGNIRVTPQELEAMSGRYAQEANEVELQVGRLNGMIQHLEGVWEGEASRAFADQYEALKPSILDMRRLLEDISQQLKKTSNALQEADAQIASQIRG
ncbi:WXG100 family type VII secretion target [Bacillus massilinigeriensis]|uniref:WXG100 family type VII secretion target n=1 Tax=Bacillus mediterraneensis TaxID=1805474 RepID=UPI0008F95805|nr:WXG100 family type VII secretion target [Bacillus mediterraneensis]